MKVTKTNAKTVKGLSTLPTQVKQALVDFSVTVVESTRMGVVRAVATDTDGKIRAEMEEESVAYLREKAETLK